MLNIVIINKELENTKKILNDIMSDNNNIVIKKIVNKISEIENLFEVENIDLIILGGKMVNKKGFFLLESVKDIKCLKYVMKYIENSKTIKEVLNNSYIYKYFNKQDYGKNQELKEELRLYKKSKLHEDILNDDLKKKIVEELRLVGYNMSHSGTIYMIEMIFVMASKNENMTLNIKRNVYPEICNKYGKSYENIKSSINKATEIMYYECDEEIMKEHFGTSYIYERPKPKNIMYIIASRVMNKEYMY